MAYVGRLQQLIPHFEIIHFDQLTLQRPSMRRLHCSAPPLAEQTNKLSQKNAQSVSLLTSCRVSTELYQPSANSIQIWALCQILLLKTAPEKLPRAFKQEEKGCSGKPSCLNSPLPIHII